MLLRCTKLHTLHLNQCVGPITSTLVAGLDSVNRWPMRDLRLSGGSVNLTDDELELLISGSLQRQQARRRQHEWAGESEAGAAGATAAAAERSGASPAGGRPDSSFASCGGQLHTLALVGCRGVSDRLLQHLSSHEHSGALQRLRLERCYSPEGCKEGLESSNGGCSGGCRGHAFSQAAVEQLACGSPQLRSLRLRHACRVSRTFVAALVSGCPLLGELLLDACDLADKGFDWEPGATFGPLLHVHVAKCRPAAPEAGDGASAFGSRGSAPCSAAGGSGVGSTSAEHCTPSGRKAAAGVEPPPLPPTLAPPTQQQRQCAFHADAQLVDRHVTLHCL